LKLFHSTYQKIDGASGQASAPSALEARVSTVVLPMLENICALTVGTDGMVFLSTDSALTSFRLEGLSLCSRAPGPGPDGIQDGQGAKARFNRPHGLAMASDGSLLVADTWNHRLRRVSPHGTVSTVAGGKGFAAGVGTAARFDMPWGILIDGHGTIYVSDWWNHCICKVVPQTGWSRRCGKKQIGFADGAAEAARFNLPTGMALDMDGTLIIADSGKHCIRKVDTSASRRWQAAGLEAIKKKNSVRRTELWVRFRRNF